MAGHKSERHKSQSANDRLSEGFSSVTRLMIGQGEVATLRSMNISSQSLLKQNSSLVLDLVPALVGQSPNELSTRPESREIDTE